MLVVNGPGVKQDELTHGASILDIAPTILALSGLPVGEDMEGRVLEVLEQVPAIDSIASWDAGQTRQQEVDSEPAEPQAAAASRALRFNRALSLMGGSRYEDAYKELSQLCELDADNYQYGIQAAFCLNMLKRYKELRIVLERVVNSLHKQLQQDTVSTNDIDYLMGCLELAEGNPARAIKHLELSRQAEVSRPGQFNQLGEAFIDHQCWSEARNAFNKALLLDPDSAHSHLGLSRCYLQEGAHQDAEAAARKTISLAYHYPLAHCCLGAALANQGRIEEAEAAARVALRIRPDFPAAEQLLQDLRMAVSMSEHGQNSS